MAKRTAHRRTKSTRPRGAAGFSLTEMLVTLLILTLAASLLAAGMPVATRTYRQTVRSANAQMALSTTATVLRSELGMATDVRVVDGAVYYLAANSPWACIRNAEDGEGQGLVKQYFTGMPTNAESDSVDGLEPYEDESGTLVHPLLSDAAVTEGLTVSFDGVELVGTPGAEDGIEFTNLHVYAEDDSATTLADMGEDPYLILVRYQTHTSYGTSP